MSIKKAELCVFIFLSVWQRPVLVFKPANISSWQNDVSPPLFAQISPHFGPEGPVADEMPWTIGNCVLTGSHHKAMILTQGYNPLENIYTTHCSSSSAIFELTADQLALFTADQFGVPAPTFQIGFSQSQSAILSHGFVGKLKLFCCFLDVACLHTSTKTALNG